MLLPRVEKLKTVANNDGEGIFSVTAGCADRSSGTIFSSVGVSVGVSAGGVVAGVSVGVGVGVGIALIV